MALRVLLADESTTIKKVMQLALQDFAVEVKAVHSGLDVLEVARAFQPDIVFADILLPKRIGYDVCGDLKKDPTLKTIPVVLMWSSFMDLDERSYVNAKANGKLEKPFDVEGLRSLILELVPKTQTQRLAHFLKFPGSFVEPLAVEEAAKSKTAMESAGELMTQASSPSSLPSSSQASIRPAPTPMPPPLSAQNAPSPLTGLPPLGAGGTASRISKNTNISSEASRESQRTSRWNMDSFDKLGHFTDEIMKGAAGADTDSDTDSGHGFDHSSDEDDDDEPVKITKLGTGAIRTGSLGGEPAPSAKQTDDNGEPWSHQDLARFKLNIPEDDVHKDEISLVFDIDGVESPDNSAFLLNNEKTSSQTPGQSSASIRFPKEDTQALNSNTKSGAQKATNPFEANAFENVRSGTVTAIRGRPRLDGPEESSDHLELEPLPGPTPPLEKSQKYEPIANIRGPEGEMISQFSAESEASASFELDRFTGDSVDHELTISGANIPPVPMGRSTDRNQRMAPPVVPNLTLEQLEAIVREQSQDIIEALVRRLVPEIATEMIRKEIDRLLRESQGGS